jgi:hypothetical protein
MPLQATSGAASYDAFGGGVPAVPQYIEDVFSTWVATSSGRVVNGLDFLGKGGLVWAKQRNAGGSHLLVDTLRGGGNFLSSDTTSAQTFVSTIIPTFYNDGFDTGSAVGTESFAYWTFRKQPKFFDVVTYTGTGSVRTVAHNLGSTPGCMIIKQTSASGEHWGVYHRSLGATKRMYLSLTSAEATNVSFWNDTEPTSTEFTVGTEATVNGDTKSYVAYLFAHNAGGFGLNSTDNVISCGSYTGNGSGSNGPTIDLGYEPQWLLIKRASGGAANWLLFDNMRGISKNAFFTSQYLYPNNSSSEISSDGLSLNATGFQVNNSNSYINASGNTYIYIAIRRGPMKVPTSGTSVFTPVAYTGDGSTRTQAVGFPTDLSINKNRAVDNTSIRWTDRLRGNGAWVASTSTGSENAQDTDGACFDNQTNIILATDRISSGVTYVNYSMRRAPSFFDEVCYTGTGASQSVRHNLGVDPELIICKKRSGATSWGVQMQLATKPFNGTYTFKRGAMSINSTAASTLSDSGFTNTTQFNAYYVTDTSATYGTQNASGDTYVAYLFASCDGVSKVFNYTGNGSSQTINCGFTGGARFVMIKRTDSTGDWYIWDSARGIVSGNDPHLSLNTTAAEVTSDDTIDTDSTGFVVNQVSATNVNVSSATYIGLAIA